VALKNVTTNGTAPQWPVESEKRSGPMSNYYAHEAAEFYVSIFKHSKINDIARYGDVGPGQQGKVMTVNFELDGQRFIALNGGPHFQFTEAISLSVSCETPAEVDTLWEPLLSGGGQPSPCGWLKDKYGLSWQIIPKALAELLGDKDPVTSQRVMKAMMGMVKIDVAALLRAHRGEGLSWRGRRAWRAGAPGGPRRWGRCLARQRGRAAGAHAPVASARRWRQGRVPFGEHGLGVRT
jgi:predicted 3-demethylubiquinone-9 3-methyltransferase (glyoxalase superfamily)